MITIQFHTRHCCTNEAHLHNSGALSGAALIGVSRGREDAVHSNQDESVRWEGVFYRVAPSFRDVSFPLP
jgi:hypothetical protein